MPNYENFINAIDTELNNNLGITRVKTLPEVNDATFHILPVPVSTIVTCSATNSEYVEAIIKMVNPDGAFNVAVKVIGAVKSGRPKAGSGFGNNLFRINEQHASIEVSFGGKPDSMTRETLKSMGFRWSHTAGVWYVSTKKLDTSALDTIYSYLTKIGLSITDTVKKA